MILGLCNGALYALIALGYTLVYGIIELINFAHGDLFMLGSIFAAVMIADVFGQKTSNPAGWLAFAITFPLAMAFCGSINVAVDQLAYRRLRNAPKLAPLITAVGVSASSSRTSASSGTARPRSRGTRVLPQRRPHIGSISIPWTYLIVVGVTIPLLMLMTWIVQKTRRARRCAQRRRTLTRRG